MYEILKLNKISPLINGILEGYALTDEAENPDGIILRSFNMADYAVGSKLKAIARAGAGVNNIPVDKMTEKGIVVFNTPGANANAVKELVLAGLLLSCRDIIGGNKWVNELPADDTVAKATEKGKAAFGGIEIFKKTLGVLGCGAIGLLVANAAKALGMNVVVYDPFLSEKARATLNPEITVMATNDEVYAVSDFVTVHIPYMPSTKNMINAETIAKMKSGVTILNMSRAELVDVTAIKAAIADGKVRKYVVDFPTADVLNEKNVIVFPHLGASTAEAEDNCAEMAAKQIKDYLENGNIVNSVNFPRVSMPRSKAVRACVRFVPGSDAAKAIAAMDDAVVGERGSIGYGIVEFANRPSDDTFAYDGILKVCIL